MRRLFLRSRSIAFPGEKTEKIAEISKCKFSCFPELHQPNVNKISVVGYCNMMLSNHGNRIIQL
jgi:hypothetical protein